MERYARWTKRRGCFAREGDRAGLMREADKVLSKITGKTAQTCVDGIDGLIFWGHSVIIINKSIIRDVFTWCRNF